MTNKKENVFNLMKRITKASKNAERYNTGLLGENLIVASYEQASISKLEKMRFIINKIIKQKKEFVRVAKAQEKSEEDNAKGIINVPKLNDLKSKNGQTIDKKE